MAKCIKESEIKTTACKCDHFDEDETRVARVLDL